MNKSQKVLAIIPARAGSRRLKDKNMRLLDGVPLVEYSLRAALECSLINKVVLSTEDKNIASIGYQCGADVQVRPDRLAQDNIGNSQVIAYVIEQLASSGEQYDVLVLLQPTSPLRNAHDITGCLGQFLQHQDSYKSAMSVCLADHHPAKMVSIKNNKLYPYIDIPAMEAQTQLLPKVYRQNGAIYITRTADFQQTHRLYQEPCLPFVMDAQRSIDIDTIIDLKLAELMLQEVMV